MKSFIIFLLLYLVISPRDLFAARNDIVVLQNGDKITGEIKELSFGRLRYKTDDMGTIYIEWEKVREITAVDQNFEVEMKNGDLYFGTLQRSRYLYRVKIRQGDEAYDLFVWQIVRITPIKNRQLARINANVSLGFDYTKASKVRKLIFQGDASYRSRRYWFNSNLSSNITSQPNKDDSKRNEFNFNGNRYLANRTYTVAKFGLQQNSELDVDLRMTVGGGMGQDVWVTNYHYLKVAGGLLMNRENTVGNPTSTTLEAIISSSYYLFIYDEPKTDITIEFNILPNLSTKGRVRSDLNVNAKYELIKDLTINLTYYFSYDTKPVSETASRSDWGINFGVGYSY